MTHIFMFMPLLAAVLFLVLPRPLALAIYLPITAFSLAIAYKAMRAQRQPPASGKAAMVGDWAVVISCGAPRETKVRYQGGIWRARHSQALHRGQKVRIGGIEGLTLWITALESSDEK